MIIDLGVVNQLMGAFPTSGNKLKLWNSHLYNLEGLAGKCPPYTRPEGLGGETPATPKL